MHHVHCNWIQQQAKIKFVAESAALVQFFDLLCCLGFHKNYLNHCTAQNCSSNLYKENELFLSPQILSEIRKL